MEHTYSYNQKKCATCEYWGGSREVNRAGSAVTYDTDDLCGPCQPAKLKQPFALIQYNFVFVLLAIVLYLCQNQTGDEQNW